MPSCIKCGEYTKYHNGLCKKCYYGDKSRAGKVYIGEAREMKREDVDIRRKEFDKTMMGLRMKDVENKVRVLEKSYKDSKKKKQTCPPKK